MKKWIPLVVIIVVVLLAFLKLSSGYNRIQVLDEQVDASWSEVLNQYKRRADLVPNLVNTVKGYTQHEKEVLEEVSNARARVGSIQIDASHAPSAEQLAAFQQAQSQMSSALSRLLAVSENYPQLKADSLYRDLGVQLEGTENRITVARGRYIKTVQVFNTAIRQFPTNLLASFMGIERKANFTVENPHTIQEAPKVDFGSK